MPLQHPRPWAVLASVLAATGLTLAVASCSGITPLGPDPAGTMPQPYHLQSPIILEAMRDQPGTTAGGCPAGYVALQGDNSSRSVIAGPVRSVVGAGPTRSSRAAAVASATPVPTCYRKVGSPVMFNSAAVSSVSLVSNPKPPPGQPAPPVQYGFTITLPAASVPALTAVTTTAYRAHGSLAITVAGRSWALPLVAGPFTSRNFQISLPRSQALQLQHLLVRSG
jgi:hypothetical protein